MGHAGVANSLLDAAMCYQWPENVREVENVVRRFLILPDLEATIRMLQTSEWR